MKTIRDLGPDFKRKDVTLYSCGCCCCCSCLHSVGAGYYFGKAAVKAEIIARGGGGKSRLGAFVIGAMLIAPLTLFAAVMTASPNEGKNIGWILIGFGPFVLPVLAFASWFSGVIAVMIKSVSATEAEHAERLSALSEIGTEFLRATGYSLIMTIPLFLATCMLGPIGLGLGMFK